MHGDVAGLAAVGRREPVVVGCRGAHLDREGDAPARRSMSARTSRTRLGHRLERERVLHLAEAHRRARREHRRREVGELAVAGELVGQPGEVGRERRGATVPSGADRPRYSAVREELVVDPARDARRAACAARRPAGACSSSSAPCRCAGTSRTRSGRRRAPARASSSSTASSGSGVSTACSTNAARSCRVTSTSTPRAPSPRRTAGSSSGRSVSLTVRSSPVAGRRASRATICVARPPKPSPVPCVPVEVAPAIVCRSMSPMFGIARP